MGETGTFKKVMEEIEKYDGMDNSQIQQDLMPIISTYNVKSLADYTGISTHTLYYICRKAFARGETSISFTTYAKLMAFWEKDKGLGKLARLKSKRQKADRKQYQHEYYVNVTREKRAKKKEAKKKEANG